MTETPCTMIGGPLDGEVRVVPENSLVVQLEDDDGWLIYRRVCADFKFVCKADTDEAAALVGQRLVLAAMSGARP